jgi:hypothetical protein
MAEPLYIYLWFTVAGPFFRHERTVYLFVGIRTGALSFFCGGWKFLFVVQDFAGNGKRKPL